MITQNYPIDISDFYEVANQGYCEFDQNGVPLIDYDRVFSLWGKFSGKYFGKQYNTVAIAQYGLAAITRLNLSACIEEKSRLKQQIYACTEWLYLNYVESDNGIYWRYDFDFPPYRVNSGFTSCMSQGFAISLLFRAHQIFGDLRFYALAIRARDFFKNEAVDINQVNFVRKFGHLLWFEEYPSNPPSRVLNGYLFAIISLNDSLNYSADLMIADIVKEAVKELPFILKFYDLGCWSKYDFYPGRTATLTYHRVHLLQLQYFFVQFECHSLAPFLERWSCGNASRYCQFIYRLKSLNPFVKLTSLCHALKLRYKND